MVKLEKYIYEDDTIYELGEHDVYYYVMRPQHYEKAISGNYAKTKLNFLLEHNLEFLVELANNDKFEEYFINYQKEMIEKENFIFSKMKIRDTMSRLLVQEVLIYQDLN